MAVQITLQLGPLHASELRWSVLIIMVRITFVGVFVVTIVSIALIELLMIQLRSR